MSGGVGWACTEEEDEATRDAVENNVEPSHDDAGDEAAAADAIAIRPQALEPLGADESPDTPFEITGGGVPADGSGGGEWGGE